MDPALRIIAGAPELFADDAGLRPACVKRMIVESRCRAEFTEVFEIERQFDLMIEKAIDRSTREDTP